jgi:hypothetical protein
MITPPAFQFYPKQWLGDDLILLMDWDARAMHLHCMCIAWQQTPPCTLPDDDDLLQRWLGRPNDWDRLKSQIFRAWKLESGRWLQSGLLAIFNKQHAFNESRRQNALKRNTSSASAELVESTTKKKMKKKTKEKEESVEGGKFALHPVETLDDIILQFSSNPVLSEVDVQLEVSNACGWYMAEHGRAATKRELSGWMHREAKKMRSRILVNGNGSIPTKVHDSGPYLPEFKGYK